MPREIQNRYAISGASLPASRTLGNPTYFFASSSASFASLFLSRPKSVYSGNHESHTPVTRAWQDHKEAEGAGNGLNGFYGIWRRGRR